MDGRVDRGQVTEAGADRPAPAAVRFELARSGDDADIRRLLRQSPMQGWVRLTLEREPSASQAATIEGDVHQCIVGRELETGRVVGLGSRSVRTVFINGREARLGYLGQLRRDPVCLGRKRLLVDGFALCRQLRQPGEMPFDLTSIMADNRMARAILTRGMRGLPIYHELEPVVTRTIPLRRGTRRIAAANSLQLVRGSVGEIPAIAAFLQQCYRGYQFAPCWTADDLRGSERTRGLAAEDFHLALRDGRIVGCLAVWDQRRFKQVVVRGYAPNLARWRWAVNLLCCLAGRPCLPPPGESLQFAYASQIAIENDDPEMFRRLLSSACADAAARGLDNLVLGLARRHPLLPVARGMVRAHEYESILYLVHWGDADERIRQLDGRVPHMEVAVL